MLTKLAKNHRKIFFIFTLLCLCLVVPFFWNSSKNTEINANADETVSTVVTEYNYFLSTTQGGFDMDTSLYYALRVLENTVYGEENDPNTLTSFSKDFFSSGYIQAEPTTEDGINIKSDLSNGILDLTTGENATYDCLKTLGEEPTYIRKISSLRGLENLQLNGITTIILDGNEITMVEENTFDNIMTLSSLSIAGNRLSNISLSGDTVSRLRSLDLSDNNLSQINLTNANGISLDLSNNNFTDIPNVSGKFSKIDISFNSITDVTKIQDLRVKTNCVPIVLVQGLENIELAGDSLLIDSSYYNLIARVEYSSDSSFSGVIARTSVNNDQPYQQLFMPAGKVRLYLEFDQSTPNNIKENLGSREFQLRLKSPTFTAMSNGKTIDSFESTENMYFSFSVNADKSLANYNDVMQYAVLYSGIGSNINPNSQINIEQNGQYNLQAYAQFDGLNSETITIQVKKDDYSGLTWTLIVVAGIAVISVSLWFVIRWFKNGAVVAPLSDREISRLNRSKQFRESGKYYDYSEGQQEDGEQSSDLELDLSDGGEDDEEN